MKFAEFGSFDYGRNYGVVYDALAYTDMLPEFGGDSIAYTDNYMTGRSTVWQLTVTLTSSVW
nr:porin [Yersinia enterocolitica]